nr:acetyl-CoA carboxylase biotin carboxyl carrier protein subunit [Streptococcus castoreus]
MEIQEIKDLMTQFDTSSLREFSFKTSESALSFSKNEQLVQVAPSSERVVFTQEPPVTSSLAVQEAVVSAPTKEVVVEESKVETVVAEGEIVASPLVGVAYLAASPDKPPFVAIGDTVKKGQTLIIIEAMKVMNEVPAPCDGIVTEILVANEEVIEFGQGLVRIK